MTTRTTPTKAARIPFTRVALFGREREYLAQAIEQRHLAGDGPFTRRCSEWLRDRLGIPAALLTTSCTHALEMAALLLDIAPGDEVILPSFTFVSTVNAFVLRGAMPVFIDSRPDTLNMDERLLESLITARTRAIVPVHYAGVGCEMDTIVGIARDRGIAVVEDNAHGMCGQYRGRWLGTFGALSTLSFHETKNFSAGEGGALLINDPALENRARVIREKGTDRARFFRGEVDKYTWVDLGSSYLPSELIAAFLLGQLESEDQIQARRRFIWETYDAELRGWAAERGIGTPAIPDHCEPSWHLYYLMLPDIAARGRLIAHLQECGVSAVFHYVPLHQSAMGRRFHPVGVRLPVAERAGDGLLRLPMYNDMTEAELAVVVDAIKTWR